MSKLLPEWSRVKSVLIAWPYPNSDWDDNLSAAQSCYWDMLFNFMQASDVIVLLHSKVDRPVWYNAYQHGLKNNNVSKFTCHIVDNIDYDDTWVRDYGPLSTSDYYLSFTFNGWGNKYPSRLDNCVAEKMASLLDKPIKKIPFIAEGGAIEINGKGIVLANKPCVIHPNRNKNTDFLAQEAYLLSSLHGRKIVWLDVPPLTGDDTDGHIDTLVRFANNETLLFCAPNKVHPDNDTLILLKAQLQVLAASNNWELIGLPTPIIYSQLNKAQLLPATYANFLICNACVFVPVYGVKEDVQALNIFSQVFEQQRIVPIRCEALLEQHGSLHCATMQIC